MMKFYHTPSIINTEVDLMAFSTIDATKFGIIDINGKKIGLSWATICPPEIIEIADFQVIAIGHGTLFMLISVLDCKVLMKFGLDFDLVLIEKYGFYLFVVTELNIMCVNLNNNSIFKIFDLPEIAENIEYRDRELVVYCIDGTVVNNII